MYLCHLEVFLTEMSNLALYHGVDLIGATVRTLSFKTPSTENVFVVEMWREI